MNLRMDRQTVAQKTVAQTDHDAGLQDAGLQVTAVVGTVKGPGENGNQYLFITADNRYVKIGEYVYYEVPGQGSSEVSGDRSGDLAGSDGRERLKILGKISDRRLIEHLPDRIFADTEISPQAIAALVGFTEKNPEIYEVSVDVIGYFDRALGFMNPRRSPDPGA